MKILLVSMKYDYGDIKRGLALDYYYFEEPLRNMGYNVISYDFMSFFKAKGKNAMNIELLNLVKTEKPDVTIVIPFTDQFIPEIIDEMKEYSKTIVYYFDDVWRLDYSKFWAKHFTYATTSDINGVSRWTEAGCNNFIYSPFGCNHNFFIKKELEKVYDVSFVGGFHPYRAWVFKKLKKAGISVHAFGYGWPRGRIKFDEMIDIFNKSKINLNLSNNESWDIRYLLSPKNALKSQLRIFKNLAHIFFRKDTKVIEMVKARHFEINACGGFQLSFYVEGLEKHYNIGSEIAIYANVDDLIEKIKYYLKHVNERTAIAEQGYKRVIRDHTMEKRLAAIFNEVGIKG